MSLKEKVHEEGLSRYIFDINTGGEPEWVNFETLARLLWGEPPKEEYGKMAIRINLEEGVTEFIESKYPFK